MDAGTEDGYYIPELGGPGGGDMPKPINYTPRELEEARNSDVCKIVEKWKDKSLHEFLSSFKNIENGK